MGFRRHKYSSKIRQYRSMCEPVNNDASDSENLTISLNLQRLNRLSESTWKRLQTEHETRINHLLGDYVERRSRHEKNPVLDFLFEYYSFRPAMLRRWVPGTGILLERNDAHQIADHEAFEFVNGGVITNPYSFPEHRANAVRWILELLKATASRSPRLGCYGLHEWAMVYRTKNIRHPYLPLRLPPDEIVDFVDSQQIVCSHFDAFRFFTKPARSLNHLQPGRDDRMEFEQPGCVHVTMDLYKWAYKIYPWISSELIADAFELAIRARTIDMQASPYDLQEYGLPPIKIETAEGRLEYSNEQRKLAAMAEPVRSWLIMVYEDLLSYQVTE